MNIWCNHLLYRCKKTWKWILLIYILAIITCFANFDIMPAEQLEKTIYYSTVVDLCMIYIFTLILIETLIMYRDYALSKHRWMMLTNKKYAYVLMDGLYMLMTIGILFIICYACYYRSILSKIDSLQYLIERGFIIPTLPQIRYMRPDLFEFFTLGVSHLLVLSSWFALLCQLSVVSAVSFIKSRRIWIDYLLIIGVALWLLLADSREYTLIFIIINCLLVILCSFKAIRAWSVHEMGEQYVKTRKGK